jgi:hypothetical protein
MDENTLWTVIFGVAATLIGLVNVWQNFRRMQINAHRE